MNIKLSFYIFLRNACSLKITEAQHICFLCFYLQCFMHQEFDVLALSSCSSSSAGLYI